MKKQQASQQFDRFPGRKNSRISAPGSLPSPATDLTYQLWALIDGQPVDRRIFELTPNASNLIEVPYIESAGAYAITLETAGGNPTSNLDQLYVIGNVG